MRTIQIGNRFEIYDDNLQTHDCLPAKTYTVKFAKMTGFYLELHSPLSVNEKVYGIHQQKVDKVLRAFSGFNRNLGVILSGNKGIGKSIFAKLLALQAVQRGIPVIIVERFIPGIASYLESIEQEVMVLFDEFDKTFSNIKAGENEPDPQAGLLSLFDGVATGKKLFVVTCNELYGLNDYLINRPGRFHYHFRFEYPSDSEIQEYLCDKLDRNYWSQIDAVIAFSRKVDLNYDCLRSIAFELNTGNDFADAIKDLNIINTHDMRYDISLHFENGTVLVDRNYEMDLFNSGDVETLWMKDNNGRYIMQISFMPSDCVYDSTRGCSTLEGDLITVVDYDDDYEAEVEAIKKTRLLYMSIKRSRSKDIHYAA